MLEVVLGRLRTGASGKCRGPTRIECAGSSGATRGIGHDRGTPGYFACVGRKQCTLPGAGLKGTDMREARTRGPISTAWLAVGGLLGLGLTLLVIRELPSLRRELRMMR